MIGDARGPFCVGFGIGWRPDCDIGDLGALGEQRFGVTRLAGADASGDQNAPIRAGEVGIDQWGSSPMTLSRRWPSADWAVGGRAWSGISGRPGLRGSTSWPSGRRFRRRSLLAGGPIAMPIDRPRGLLHTGTLWSGRPPCSVRARAADRRSLGGDRASRPRQPPGPSSVAAR